MFLLEKSNHGDNRQTHLSLEHGAASKPSTLLRSSASSALGSANGLGRRGQSNDGGLNAGCCGYNLLPDECFQGNISECVGHA